MNFKEMLEGIFDPGTEEYQIIEESYQLIASTAPTIAAEAKTHLLLLDHMKIKLATLYYMLGRNISKMRVAIQSTYDASYTRLVKLGRPSNAAIETEIRATNPEYAGISRKIDDYEAIRELINNYIRCLDSSKTTTLEVLRDSRRID